MFTNLKFNNKNILNKIYKYIRLIFEKNFLVSFLIYQAFSSIFQEN